ncbi:MAG: HNH endonuclease signature motif containing protein [Candidatus Latescibacterota bacterium]
MMSLKNISNQELTGRLRQLVRKEKNLTLAILPHLAEVERRGLYLEKAYSTMTEYCVCELGYGDSSASRRVRAARVISKIPEVYDLLKASELTISAVVQVYRVLTPDNKDSLLPRLVGKSRSEIEHIIGEYVPPRVIFDQARPTLVQKVSPVQRALTGGSLKAAGKRAGNSELGEMTRHCDGSNSPTDKISTPEAIIEKMFEIRFAADEELMELIRWAKSYLSHKYPNGPSFQEIFKFALSYLREREDLALQDKPRKSSAKTNTRYIPKTVKQQVWKRDKGRCTYVGSNGKRCNSEHNLEYDHYPVPYARGGPSTANNLRLLCAKHNKHAAIKTYGEHTIKKNYVKEPRSEYLPIDQRMIC